MSKISALFFAMLALMGSAVHKVKPAMPLAPISATRIDSIVIPKGYFASPLDLSLTLAGNFGEPRRLHFHTGLDFRTNQEEGHKVFAAADGYICRINVSSVGYGNALYIRHANGFVSVYGHLQQFTPVILERLRKEQYAKESFAVDFNLTPDELPVKQGEQIALSGNTGGSGGPHLHFEIRDTLDNIYNPMLFGIELKDDLKPIVNNVRFYAMDSLKGRSEAYTYKLHCKNGICDEEVVKLNDRKVGFAINTYDVMNNTDAHTGIYNMTVFDSSRMIYDFKINSFSFPEKRCVLSHVDYAAFLNEGRKSYHKCYVEPGNRCPVYDNLVNAGIVDLSDGKVHPLLIEISDYAGNVTLAKLKLQFDTAATAFKKKELKYTQVFNYAKSNEYSTPEFKLKVPANALFDDVYFNYAMRLTADPLMYSKIHQVDNSNTQDFDWFDISVKAERLPENLRSKALMVYEDNNGETATRGGTFADGFVSARSREFGKYYIKVDSTAPVIKPLNISEGKSMKAVKKILVKITDNLSGIADFDTYIDGKWVVTDYDAKNSLLTHSIPEDLSAGPHTFTVRVSDERKNTVEYSVKFAW
ncbi:MAG: M23 family metallopeptidase [Chitinophagales bacterium]